MHGRWRRCSRFWTVPNSKYHAEAVVSSGGRGGNAGPTSPVPGGDAHRRQNQMWDDLFSNPSEWWDNRLDKRSSGCPDFQHKRTNASLWVDCEDEPPWVQSWLSGLHLYLQGDLGLLKLQNLCKEGDVDKAVQLVLNMDQKGVCPSVDTYKFLLRTCSKRKDLANARRLHSQVAQNGLELTMTLAEEVVSTFVSCDALEDALRVFYRWPNRTVFSWTTIISGCSDAGQGRQALRMYALMKKECLEPNKHTLVAICRACASVGDLEEGIRIHSEVLKYKCGADPAVLTSLLEMYAKCGGTVDARKVFDQLSKPSQVSWNTMLKAYVRSNQAENALKLYKQMQEKGVSPDDRSFVSVIQACGMAAESSSNLDRRTENILERAKAVHADVHRKGRDTDLFVANTLISMYGKCGSVVDAQKVFDRLRQPGVVSWNALMTVYAQQGLLDKALQIYQLMRENGASPNDRTYSSLISIYGKRGSILDAKHCFYRLSHRDVVSWNAWLSAHVERCYGKKTLLLYKQMQDEGVSPNNRTFVCALQACGIISEMESPAGLDGQLMKEQALREGKAIHLAAMASGYDSDVFVSSTLISMYGKCGSILDARDVFDGLRHHSLVAWNALLAAYVMQGHAEEALVLYTQMQEEGASPNDWSVVTILQACAILAEHEVDTAIDGHCLKVKSFNCVKAIHAKTKGNGYDSDTFVGSTLISTYGKCGGTVDAQRVFDELSRPSTVSYNAMLTTLIQQRRAEKVLQLYEQMLEDMASPDVRTYVVALRACSVLAEEEYNSADALIVKAHALARGKALHTVARRIGCDLDVFIGNCLITMYGKCGAIVDANAVFDGILQLDVVSWNSLLTAYVEQSLACKALHLYEEMQVMGVSPDVWTFLNAIQICGLLADEEEESPDLGESRLMKVESLAKGKAIHADAQRKGHASHVFITNSLVSMYGKCGSMVDVQIVFDGLSERDAVSWNTVLKAFAEQGQGQKLLQLYRQMEEEGVSPDVLTFVSLVRGCGMLAEEEEDAVVDEQPMKLKALQKGRAVHVSACRKRYGSDSFVGSALVSMYGKCGSISEAQNVFNRLSKNDVVSWNAMLSAYIEQGYGEKALQLFWEMKEQGLRPDDVTLLCILRACSMTGSLSMIRWMRDELVFTGSRAPSSSVASALISACGKCASMDDAQSVFDGLRQPDKVSWNALIAGYARQGNVPATLQSYENMLLSGVKPDRTTFLAILSSCCHAGLVDKGVEYFQSMTVDHAIAPGIEHYVSIVDLIARAGYFSMVEVLLSTMPMPPDLAMCLSLLGACRKHGKVGLAKRAFDWAVSLQPRHVAAYVLMSSIYSDAGLWVEDLDIKDLRRKACAWKNPGQSWIEYDQQVHTFVVGACSDMSKKQVNELIKEIGHRLQVCPYPDSSGL